MLKKTAFMLFVLIANVLLVVHGILPHQHFGGFAWFPADHSQQHSHPAEIHPAHADHHHHDADHQHQDQVQDQGQKPQDQDQNHDHACLLAQAYLVPGNTSRLECPLTDYLNQIVDFQIVFIHPDSSEYLPIFYKIPLPPLIPPDRNPTPFVLSSGLRAPPVR